MKLRQIIKRVLKEENENKEKVLVSILKKFIPDNTVGEFSYPLPYADQGKVDVEIEFSIGSDLGVTTVENDGKFSGYILTIPLIIHDAQWKGPGEGFHPIEPRYFKHSSLTLVGPLVGYVSEKIWKGIPIIDKSFKLIFDNGEELNVMI